jgi:hypothetical protein
MSHTVALAFGRCWSGSFRQAGRMRAHQLVPCVGADDIFSRQLLGNLLSQVW